jgi:hypothetical protein
VAIKSAFLQHVPGREWRRGTWVTVDDPDGQNAKIVNAINDNGVLVGFYGTNPSGFVATPME